MAELPVSMKKILLQAADVAKFVGKTLSYFVKPPFEVKEISKQCFAVGYRSLFLIGFTSFIAGVVFTRQSRPSLASFGAESWLPSLVSQAVVRALGPLITALICAGKLGSNISAELGSMRVSEQIDAMEVSGVRPFSYLVSSRVIATTVMLPILVIYADLIALFGSYVTVNSINGSSLSLFINEALGSITYLDIFSSIIKAILFGYAIGVIGCYTGYYATGGTMGVGKAANSAVVTSMLSIFIIELIVLQFVTFLRQG
ncbi:MAG: ABC transporter permease [Azospira oryzae]|jgi:phospholipid/cholesterol/gamma-HCH transport system permease protein|nr:MAG: ABC transporter permease [Azospira oryzae]